MKTAWYLHNALRSPATIPARATRVAPFASIFPIDAQVTNLFIGLRNDSKHENVTMIKTVPKIDTADVTHSIISMVRSW